MYLTIILTEVQTNYILIYPDLFQPFILFLVASLPFVLLFVYFLQIFFLYTKADAPADDGKSPFITARAVTTRTATTHEDLGTNARTQQLEEKTVAHSMTSSATRQEQRTVTQEVKTTSTVVSGDQVNDYFCFDFSHRLM